MRILTRELHRAFPELDPFDDEQCLRFVKRARQGRAKQLFGAAVVIAATIPFLLVGLGITTAAFDKMRVELYWPAFASKGTLIWMGISIPSLGFGPAIGYLVRDWLLRRWVRVILRTQGQCPGCGYNVLGLRLDEHSAVQCPECGLRTVVNAALGELELDSKGRHVTVEDGRRVVCVHRTRRSKWWKRIGIGLAVLIFVLLPMAAGVNELFVRAQAGRAKADLVILSQATRDLITSMQTSPPGPSAWVPLAQAGERVAAAASILQQKQGLTPGMEWSYLFEAELMAPSVREQNHYRELVRRAGSVEGVVFRGQVIVGRLEAEGVYELLDEVGRRRCTLPWDSSGALLDPQLEAGPIEAKCQPKGLYPAVAMQNHWVLTQACVARLAMAARLGNVATFARAYEEGLAVSRVESEIPWQRFRRASNTLHHQAIHALVLHPEADWVAAVRQANVRQPQSRKTSDSVEASRLHWQAELAAFFQDPAGSRLGQFSKPYRERMKNAKPSRPRLGTYEENIGLISEFHDAARSHLSGGEPISSFVWSSPLALNGELPGLVASLPSSFSWWGLSECSATAVDAGLEAVLSITEFRIAMGRLPDSLGEVERWKGSPLPLDPFSQKPLVYTALQCGPGGEVITYRLLSVGKNGVANAIPVGPPVAPSGMYTDDVVFVDGYEVAR